VSGSEPWPGIPAARVVAVVASLRTGMVQVGSGYILGPAAVITARHCTQDQKTGLPATALLVIRLSDGAQAPAKISSASLDVAVLVVEEAASWTGMADLRPPSFGRVDAAHSGELYDCQAVGFPLWQLDSRQQHRAAAEVHGVIRTIEGAESGLLVLRDPLLWNVEVPDNVTQQDRAPGSPWGGLSGALVFHGGLALGIVIEHHPRQGHSALTVLPVQRIAALAGQGDLDAAQVVRDLGLPAVGQLPLAQPARADDPALTRIAVGVQVERRFWQASPADQLSSIVVTALRAAGISLDHCEQQDSGDGRQIITLPAGVTAGPTLPSMLLAMQLAARHANADPRMVGRLRPQVSLARGPVQLAAGRHVGPGITAADGMLESGLLGEALDSQEQADLAAMISDDLYALIIGQSAYSQIKAQGARRWEAAEVRAVDIVLLGAPGLSRCWLYVPHDLSSRGAAFTGFSGTRSIGDVSEKPSATRWALFGAIPVVGAGTMAWWETERHHHDAVPAAPSAPTAGHPTGHHAPQDLSGSHELPTPDSRAADPWSAHLPPTGDLHHDHGIDHLAGAGPESGLATFDEPTYDIPGLGQPGLPHHLDDVSGPADHGDSGDSADW
jgi:hypothetical protein